MSSAEFHPLEKLFDDAWPSNDWCGSHVLLAVSGGADSVAMLRCIAAIKARAGGQGHLYAAHLNHGLRGEASNADAEWVRRLCEGLQIPLEIEKLDVAATAQEQGDGWEAAARSVRYAFLRSVAERLGARYVAVAHTADDQVETVLHRILRGTGIQGLRGIPFARALSPSVALVRPLLKIRRQQVLTYLTDIGQDFRTDASNADVQFTRNRLRHELLPLLRANFNAEIDNTLLRLAAQAEETHQWLGGYVDELVRETVTVEVTPAGDGGDQLPSSRLQINCRTLAERPAVVVRELCRQAWAAAGWPQQGMGFGEWQLLASLTTASAKVPPINLPGNFRASRCGDSLTIEALSLP
jgi:tRNA(Ile)-lysidine synthase